MFKHFFFTEFQQQQHAIYNTITFKDLILIVAQEHDRHFDRLKTELIRLKFFLDTGVHF